MGHHLFDFKGYEIKLEMTNTFNPYKEGIREDDRELGVFLQYLGAAIPEYQDITYVEDPYVYSKLAFPFKADWDYQIVRGAWANEETGMWVSASTTIYLKDIGIRKSGLKITYHVPRELAAKKASLNVYVNGGRLKSFKLIEEGIFTEILDVSESGREIEEYLESAQRILKKLLMEFDRVCAKYGLHYYLICGGLLGAVRHQDLIPWDDDVDVAMPRKDFEILLKYTDKEWGDNNDFLFLNYNQMGNHSFLDYMTRIVYMKEEIPIGIYRKIRGKGRRDIDNHMPLDIYVLDNASDNEKIHKFQTEFIRGLYGLAMGHRAYIDLTEYENRDAKTRRIIKFLSLIGKYIPLSWIFGCYEWVRKWNRNKECESYFESNGFIYCIPWKFKQEWFGEGVRLRLGEITVNVPANYEAFLKMHYGSFMLYPPMEARKPTHSVDASGIF